MISAMFTEVAAAITSFSTVLAQSVTNVTALFYDATNGITPLGSLLLIGVGVGLVYFAFRLIKGLVSIRRA